MSSLLALGNGIVGTIIDALGTIIYPLFSIIFVLIDGVQDIFKAFAGTGNINFGGKTIKSTNSGEETETGLLYYLFQHDIIRNLLFSIMLLAIILLIVFTVMAFIKNAYAAKQKSWKDIVGSALIGLANFVFIPVCCLLGVWLGNILLNAIEGATNITEATSMSRQLFISAAYNANDIRNGTYQEDHGDDWADDLVSDITILISDAGLEGVIVLDDSKKTDLTSTDAEEKDAAIEYYAGVIDQIYTKSEKLDIGGRSDVADWYTLMDINYILLAGGGAFLLYALGVISFGMVKRLFTLLLLFVVSPALCAMYPLDDGGAVKKWKDDFIKNTISAYGAVAGLNIFFSIAPLIQMIETNTVLDTFGLTSVLLTIAGLYMVKDFINMITGYIGAGNAYGDGSGLMGSVQKRVKQGVGTVNKATKTTAGAFGKARGNAKVGGFGAGVKSLVVDSMLKSGLRDGASKLAGKTFGLDFMGMKKEYDSAFKDSKEKQEGVQRYKEAVAQYNAAIAKKDEEGAAAAMAKVKRAADALGLGAKGIENAAKNIGVSVDTFKASVEAHKAIEGAKKTYEEAVGRKDTLDAAFKEAIRNDKFDDLNAALGIKIEDIAVARGLDPQLIVQELKNGVVTQFDEKAFRDKSSLTGPALDAAVSEARIQYASMNKAAGDVSSINDKSKEAAEGVLEAVKSAKGKLLGSDAQPVDIKAAISELESKISSGNKLELDAGAMEALKDAGKKLGEAADAQMRDTKKVLKALEKKDDKK
ncbi:MAG: hypothetical protein IKM43_01110 [Clostridia bacterium]|nr:hypothetical protein [Clostridia bacterium]